MSFFKELFCHHRFDKVIILPGCKARNQCSKCYKLGKVYIQHSWGPWKQFEESWGCFDRATGVKMKDYVRVMQSHSCVRCEYTEREEIKVK